MPHPAVLRGHGLRWFTHITGGIELAAAAAASICLSINCIGGHLNICSRVPAESRPPHGVRPSSAHWAAAAAASICLSINCIGGHLNICSRVPAESRPPPPLHLSIYRLHRRRRTRRRTRRHLNICFICSQVQLANIKLFINGII
jgi:hypothetical protein